MKLAIPIIIEIAEYIAVRYMIVDKTITRVVRIVITEKINSTTIVVVHVVTRT